MSFATKKLLPLVLCLLCLSSFSQKEFNTYTKNNGLTSNTILTSIVDSKGIVWLGTADGVSAFVNNSWVGVKSISDNSGYKKNIGRVYLLFETGKGDIWVVSEKGFYIYNREFWTHFDDTDDQGFLVTDIFEDRNGWVWIISEKSQSLKDVSDLGFSIVEGDLQMYDGMQWHDFTREIGGAAAITIGAPTKYFTSHLLDVEGNMWVSNMDGIYKFNGNRWIEYDKEMLPADICYQVIQSKENDIWVATKRGVAKQDGNSWIKYEKNKGIKGNEIMSVFADKNNKIWVTAKRDNRLKYLCMFDGLKWKAFSKDHLKFKGEITQLLNFNNQVMAFSKNGISLFDGSKWVNIIKDNNVNDDNFSNLILKSNDNLIFTGKKGLYELTRNMLKTVYVVDDGWKPTKVIGDNDGNIWVGTAKSGLFLISGKSVIVYNTDNGLPSNGIINVFRDRQDNIWVVTKAGISMIKL